MYQILKPYNVGNNEAIDKTQLFLVDQRPLTRVELKFRVSMLWNKVYGMVSMCESSTCCANYRDDVVGHFVTYSTMACLFSEVIKDSCPKLSKSSSICLLSQIF